MRAILRHKWIIARFLIIAVNVFGIAAIPKERSNLDWGACFLISVIVSVGLFAWLTAIRYKKDVDWSEPNSWRKPFYPMKKYPLRFWFLTAYSFMLAGIVAMSTAAIVQSGHEAVGGTIFFIGLFVVIALKIWIKKFTRNV